MSDRLLGLHVCNPAARVHPATSARDSKTMHKPSEVEVMHFILHVRVWLNQGFHVNPASLHGYGQSLCCMRRMSNPNQPDDVTSGSNVPNPPDTRRPQMRQQTTADDMAHVAAVAAAARAAANTVPAASQGAQSVTATIDYNSLAAAMSA